MTDFFEKLHSSVAFKAVFISFLVILLLIPMAMVKSVISERSHLYRSASSEISGLWGGKQLLVGPVLSIPYVEQSGEISGWRYNSKFKHIVPNNINVNINVDTQIRHRGIYKVPVYTANIMMSGMFDLTSSNMGNELISELQLDKAVIQVPIQNNRAIKDAIHFKWDSESIDLVPELEQGSDTAIIFKARLSQGKPVKGGKYKFSLQLKLAGNEEFSFVSSAKESHIRMQSNWSAPGFFGVYLPSRYEINDEGFSANWDINDYAIDLAHVENGKIATSWFSKKAKYGVRLIHPVDTYQIVTRSAKYSVFFISLTFLVCFLTEMVGKINLHAIQYLFIGLANCIFYLLFLSLSEHINLNLSYIISSLSSIILVSLYCLSVLARKARALIMFSSLSGLYMYLFITIKSEDYALLSGSIGLFVILALTMYLTRNIIWSKDETYK